MGISPATWQCSTCEVTRPRTRTQTPERTRKSAATGTDRGRAGRTEARPAAEGGRPRRGAAGGRADEGRSAQLGLATRARQNRKKKSSGGGRRRSSGAEQRGGSERMMSPSSTGRGVATADATRLLLPPPLSITAPLHRSHPSTLGTLSLSSVPLPRRCILWQIAIFKKVGAN